MSERNKILYFPVPAISPACDFLDGKSKGTHSRHVEISAEKKVTLEEKLAATSDPIITDELLFDLKNLKATALRRKYHREANSHKNRKAACKKNGGQFHAEFQEFRSFLGIVGLCPSPNCSLDRIDNANPDYGPGLVRWADHQTQNNNKGDTTTLAHNGVTKPLVLWAEETGQKPNTLRVRRYRGWPDEWVIFGKPSDTLNDSSSDSKGIWAEIFPNLSDDQLEGWENFYQADRKSKDTRESWLFRTVGRDLHELVVHIPPEDSGYDPDPETVRRAKKVQRVYDLLLERRKRRKTRAQVSFTRTYE